METGKIVWLKSGGPKMTVGNKNVHDSRYVRCAWFIGNDLKEGEFHIDQLTEVEPKTSMKPPRITAVG